MALEELIVNWSKERPPWQREIMRRVAGGDKLSEADIEALVEDLVTGKTIPEPQFGLSQFPHSTPGDPPVTLLSIENPAHVNALESKDPLTFEPQGLTIVYGDNGSGKSGYARLLKRIARSRHQEDVLSDVFRDTALSKPTAILSVQIATATESLSWPDSSCPELKRMLFYDAACGGSYITSESDFPYRPSALFVMDGLIDVCVAARARIDAKLADNEAAKSELPTVPEQARETEVGRFLADLSGSSKIEDLDALIATSAALNESIDELRLREAHLQSAGAAKERQLMVRRSEKLQALRAHLESLQAVLGAPALAELQKNRAAVSELDHAAALLAKSFQSEPLPGAGSAPWKTLLEAAKRFSEGLAYPDQAFPFLGNGCRCVLCQQTLDTEAQSRFARFDAFLKAEVQLRLEEARRVYESGAHNVNDLIVLPDAVAGDLKDLETTHLAEVAEIRELLDSYAAVRAKTLDGLGDSKSLSQPTITILAIVTRLEEASDAAMATAGALASPEGIEKQLQALATRRAELELLEKVKDSRPAIVSEITRLSEREKLEAAKSSAATTGVTKKIVELSEDSITEVVRDTFTRETDRLRLERVTIARTRADRGAMLHQPKLVGSRQEVTLPRVFSEGERTALGLAAFFTEALLDGSASALVLDDPVTSLDHIRRGLVASRLASLAENRQVILFTHDVAFVADLKREASAKGVAVFERSVTRSRSAERKPGACTTKLPWKVKDVASRLDQLRQDLSRIKKDSNGWDEKEYEESVALWAGNLSETWERIFSQEVVGPILAEGGLEVRPKMVKALARFSLEDHQQFDGSYSRASQWAKRHDKSAAVNFVAPDVGMLEKELQLVEGWFKRVKAYQQ